MSNRGFLHHHGGYRSRQLRWVFSMGALLLAAALVTLAVQYRVSDEAVGTEFFHAHKTISHTGQLLQHGLFFGAAALTALVAAICLWALRVTHRIVRPVHTLHRALDALVSGDLGVRVALHRHDEFQEVGDALNRLIDEFATALERIHGLVDDLEAVAAEAAREAHDESAAARLHRSAQELDRTMEFFRLAPRRVIEE